MARRLKTGVRVEGVSALGHAIARNNKVMAARAEISILAGGEKLLEMSKEIVPVETGDLRDSGRVDLQGRGFLSVAEVSYNTPYAVRQHEDLTYQHKAGQSAKYLEIPLRTRRREIRATIVRTWKSFRR